MEAPLWLKKPRKTRGTEALAETETVQAVRPVQLAGLIPTWVTVGTVLDQKLLGKFALRNSPAISVVFALVPRSRVAPRAAPSTADCNLPCTTYTRARSTARPVIGMIRKVNSRV